MAFGWIKRLFGARENAQGQGSARLFMDVLREYCDRYTIENNLGAETEKRYQAYIQNWTRFCAASRWRIFGLSTLKSSGHG